MVPINRAGKIGHSFVKTGIPGAPGRMFIPAFEAQQHTQQSRVRVYARREDAVAATRRQPMLAIGAQDAAHHYAVQEVEFDDALRALFGHIIQADQETNALFSNMPQTLGLLDVFDSSSHAGKVIARTAMIPFSRLKIVGASPSLTDALEEEATTAFTHRCRT